MNYDPSLIEFANSYLKEYKFEGPVIVTGATGLIGKSVIQAIELLNPEIKIYALCRNKEKLRNDVSCRAEFVHYELDQGITTNIPNAYIIHCAAPTSSHDFYYKANSVFDLIVKSTDLIAKYAIENHARSLLFLSSLEVYGENTGTNLKLKEDDYFGMDPLNPRNSYALAKLVSENRLSFYFKEITIPVKILRLAQVFGKPSNYDDGRVVFYFARQIIENNNIYLKTSGRTYRNYIHYLDLIEVIIRMMIDDHAGVSVYNVAHPKTATTIKELAERFIEVSGKNIEILYDYEDNKIYRDDLFLALDVNKLLETGWIPKINLDKSIASILESMNKIKDVGS